MTISCGYRRSLRCLFILLVVAGCLTACTDAAKSKEKRANRAAASRGPIVIGVVDTNRGIKFSFLRGAEMAVAELNQQGGVLDRQIKLIVYDDKGDKTRGQKLAQKLARNPDVIAVVGHMYSQVAIPVAIIYERNGILFLSPGAEDPKLTGADFFAHTFRTTLTSEAYGRLLAEFAKKKGFGKMVILQRLVDHTERLANSFHEMGINRGIDIVAVRSYMNTKKYFNDLIAEIKILQPDAIFLADELPGAAEVIKQARAMEVTLPFLGGSGLDSEVLLTEAGEAAEGTIVATLFNPYQEREATHDFVTRFKAFQEKIREDRLKEARSNQEREILPDFVEFFNDLVSVLKDAVKIFKIEFKADRPHPEGEVPRFVNELKEECPNAWDAQGYDAIRVLAEAIKKSRSTVPIAVSNTLRFLKDWEGVSGPFSFTPRGDITGRPIFFKVVRNGKFEFLEDELTLSSPHNHRIGLRGNKAIR